MLSTRARSGVLAGWIASLAIIVAVSLAMGANMSTIALLLGVGVAPAVVTTLLAHGAPSPSVAEILHSVETKGGQS
jgi:hypothetical protein